MTVPRIITAAEAAALLDAATPGPWSTLPITMDYAEPDLQVRVQIGRADFALMVGAPDLAASVVVLRALLGEAYDIINGQNNPAWEDWCHRAMKADDRGVE